MKFNYRSFFYFSIIAFSVGFQCAKSESDDSSGNNNNKPPSITQDTVDKTPPTVVSVSPLDRNTNIPVNTAISVTFSESMDKNTVKTNTNTAYTKTNIHATKENIKSSRLPNFCQHSNQPVSKQPFKTVDKISFHKQIKQKTPDTSEVFSCILFSCFLN